MEVARRRGRPFERPWPEMTELEEIINEAGGTYRAAKMIKRAPSEIYQYLNRRGLKIQKVSYWKITSKITITDENDPTLNF